jgi:hypothetical protein
MLFWYTNDNDDNKEDGDIKLGVPKADVHLDKILGKKELPATKKGDNNYVLDIITGTKIMRERLEAK